MRIFLDTNILLDIVEQRAPHAAASEAVLDRCDLLGWEISVAAHGLATIFNIVRRRAGQATAMSAVHQILAWADVAPLGDAEARRMIRESGRQIGEVLSGAINLLNPEVVIVGGDMAQAYDTFVAGLRETLYGNAIAVATQQLQILPWTHGELSGVVGSATMALDHVLSVRAVDRLLAQQK